MSLDPAARAKLKAEGRASIDRATEEFSHGLLARADWQRRVSDILAYAYLSDDDPRWQSGFDGDATLWREARSLVLEAVPATGSFLDVGCANGHLIESLRMWAAERGLRLEFYGLELNPDLAATARRRLPDLAERIYIGNVSDWEPPRRFTCVRTGLEYAPAGEEPVLLVRVARCLVERGGRVIVGPVADDAVAATREAFAAAQLGEPRIVSAGDHNGKQRHVLWAQPDDASGKAASRN